MFFRAYVVGGVFLLGVFLIPSHTYAQQADTCTCFCGTDQGVKKLSEQKTTSEKCESGCEAKEQFMAVCAKTPRQFPGNNALCFDADACSAQDGVLAKYQAPECPAGWAYCFPKPEANEFKLSTQIGTLKTVGDLGTYIEGVYAWMVGAAGFFAIVMMLIGGLQWVLSAGGAGSIAQAKERILNGMIGLVLVFSVVLILQTINPQLLKLEVPRPSKLRIINLAANSCENLEEQKYTLELEPGAKKECGGTAVIAKGPKEAPVADGLTCQYTKCEKGGCVSTGAGTPSVCMECHAVSKDNPSGSGIPSKAGCQALSTFNIDSSGNGTAMYCQFKQEGYDLPFNAAAQLLIPGAVAAAQLEDLDKDSCMEVVVDCGFVGEDCEKYDDLPVKIFDDGGLEEWPLWRVDRSQLGTICESDPCKVKKKKNEKVECVWDGDDDCDNKSVD